MEGNPYAAMAAMMQGPAQDGESEASTQAGLGAVSARMRLGRVVSVEPLAVSVAGMTMPASALRVNERLVKGARWKTKTTSPSSDYGGLSGPVEGPVSTPMGAGALVEVTGGELHSTGTTIDEAEVEQLELDLEAGDEVLLLTPDDQVFYIIMKVAAV